MADLDSPATARIMALRRDLNAALSRKLRVYYADAIPGGVPEAPR